MVFAKIKDMYVREIIEVYRQVTDSLQDNINRMVQELQGEIDIIGQTSESSELLTKHPEFAKELQGLLVYVQGIVKENETLTEPARTLARERGYIDY